jgi:hypothetical protein
MTFRWEDKPNARVDIYLTTGDQSSLLKQQPSVSFRN